MLCRIKSEDRELANDVLELLAFSLEPPDLNPVCEFLQIPPGMAILDESKKLTDPKHACLRWLFTSYLIFWTTYLDTRYMQFLAELPIRHRSSCARTSFRLHVPRTEPSRKGRLLQTIRSESASIVSFEMPHLPVDGDTRLPKWCGRLQSASTFENHRFLS